MSLSYALQKVEGLVFRKQWGMSVRKPGCDPQRFVFSSNRRERPVSGGRAAGGGLARKEAES
jgi:hypothetical protein